MRVVDIVWALVTVLGLAVAPAKAQIIVNGSFETPPVPSGSFTDYSGGSTGITGWTVVGIDVAVISGTFAQNGITFEAQNGNQWVDLTGNNSNSPTNGVTQTVATTNGLSYLLSFYVGSATDNTFYFASTVGLSINGGTVVSYTNPTAPTNMLNWEQFTAGFTATGSTTNITFFNRVAGNNNCSLDSVSLSPVPEPSTLLLGCGAAGAISCGMRKRRAKRQMVAA
jgi:hypothetical protein